METEMTRDDERYVETTHANAYLFAELHGVVLGGWSRRCTTETR